MAPALAALATVLAAFIKGAIGFGFPTLGTPLLSLFVDVKTAVVILIVPNIVMDVLQFARQGWPLGTVRRFALLLVFGAIGTVAGTRLLVAISSTTATLILGLFIVAFVALGAAGVTVRVPARWEQRLSTVVGLVTGIVGGITNVPGTPLVIYFQALDLPKREFVSSTAFTFVVYKLIQLGAVVYYGLLPLSLVPTSLALTLVALGGFAIGLKVQDRLEQRTFNRAVLVFLALLGLWLVARSLPRG
jgi:uncharacterized protein